MLINNNFVNYTTHALWIWHMTVMRVYLLMNEGRHLWLTAAVRGDRGICLRLMIWGGARTEDVCQ